MIFDPVNLTYLQYFLLYFCVSSFFFFLIYLYYILFYGKNEIVKIKKKQIIESALIFNSFSVLGLSIGLITGLSRETVAGIVVSALLTFMAGFVTYIFVIKGNTGENRRITLVILTSISLSVMIGVDIGIKHRILYEDDNRALELHNQKELEYYKAQLELDKAKELNPK